MNYFWGNGRLEAGQWTGKPDQLQYWTHEGATEWFAVDETARAKAIAKKPKGKKTKNENTDDKVTKRKANDGEYTLDND